MPVKGKARNEPIARQSDRPLLMGQRLRAERERLDMSLADAAMLTGLPEGLIQSYEESTAETASTMLTTFGTVGVDVLYVVTGARNLTPGGNLPPEGVLRQAVGKLASIDRLRLLLFLIADESRRTLR